MFLNPRQRTYKFLDQANPFALGINSKIQSLHKHSNESLLFYEKGTDLNFTKILAKVSENSKQ